MRSRVSPFGLILLVLVAVSRAKEPTTRPTNDLKPLVELSGAHSHFDKPTYLRITSVKEFQETYMRHLGKDMREFDTHYNIHQVPTIDFDRCMVIAVFRGAGWNSSGISAVSISDTDRVVFRFDDRSYQTSSDFTTDGKLNVDTDDDRGGNKVTPFGIFVVPRSEKELVLENNVQNLKGRPPVWKEVARFPSTASK